MCPTLTLEMLHACEATRRIHLHSLRRWQGTLCGAGAANLVAIRVNLRQKRVESNDGSGWTERQQGGAISLALNDLVVVGQAFVYGPYQRFRFFIFHFLYPLPMWEKMG